MNLPLEIQELITRGALFVVNHSGGKDSQAMYDYVKSLVPASQIVIVHADLPDVEWEGVQEHIRATIGDMPLHVCRARRTLLEMIEERGLFPSPSQRQCTSDLKRGPIEKTIRHILKANPQFGNYIVNCMGMRAAESTKRSKLNPFTHVPYENKKGIPTGKSLRKRILKSGRVVIGREWYEWLPIHHWSTPQVFARIKAAGQEPHWAYKAGMTRLSCCFCIMASKADLTTAARLKPDLYRRYVELEHSTGQTMMMPEKGKNGRLIKKTLEQITGIPVIQLEAAS